MLFETTFSAASVPTFPDKTICLTFDDGPAQTASPDEAGPRSLELAQYLESMEVQATFFVVGRQIQQFPGIVEEMNSLGHQLGVHTYDHVGLDDYLVQGGDVVRQIELTSNLLSNCGCPLYLRAPYGQWSGAVARALNADLATCATCFGPIHWDNNATDWDKWLEGVDPAEVARQYFEEIETMRRGIILMHDNMANVRRFAGRNRGLELAKNLVPQLLDAGYHLCRVDAIPAIAAAAAAAPRIALLGNNQAFVSPQDGGDREILLTGAAPSWWEKLAVVPLGGRRFAFQAPGGQYFSAQDEDGSPVMATASEIGEWETFEAIQCRDSGYMFRTYTGDFLRIGDGAALAGNGGQTDPNNRFSTFLYTAEAAQGGV